MSRGRGGRAAALPDGTWEAPQRTPPGGPDTTVVFIEETSGTPKVFDFSRLPGEAGVQCWLARAFARRTGPRSGVKRLESARGLYYTCRRFAAVLADMDLVVHGPAGLTGAHIAAFTLRYAGMPTGRADLITLRALLRDDDELPEPARAALLAGRLPQSRAQDRDPVVAYDAQEWQLIMTALRRDVRAVRDRISAGRALLARYRAGEITAGPDARLGAVLDMFDRTGDVPREKSGNPARRVTRAGGVDAVAALLCLTAAEMTAFCLLLTALTATNFGTVAAWPAISFRPGGGGDGPGGAGSDPASAVTLVEQVKPRRGPEREHMVTALEDLPAALAGVLTAEEADGRLFRSPARLYWLLVDLTACSRRHRASTSAFTAFGSRAGGFIDRVGSHHVQQWARAGSFPAARTASAGAVRGAPSIDVRRIRQTAIEHAGRPVAHTRATMNDRYLARSQNVRDDSRIVVADALRDQEARARTAQAVPVFTAAFCARFGTDPDATAAEVGLDAAVLTEMIAGRQDTAVTSCIDHLSGPHTHPGQVCTASFLTCLDCVNARALPHQLPVQHAMAEQLAALRPHLDPTVWRARFQRRLHQLDDIFAAYTAAEHDQARAAITGQHRSLAGDVLSGDWDLR